ncbi:MAG: ferredoxin [Alphaproteobacteria bacterium]|nr:ferredoxin [Alphaproteobacteria bacterium]
MKICVDRNICRRHGQCAIAAPDLFSFKANGEMVYVEHPDEKYRNDAEDAADACPEQAITIDD